MLNENTLGVKKVRGQAEEALWIQKLTAQSNFDCCPSWEELTPLNDLCRHAAVAS